MFWMSTLPKVKPILKRDCFKLYSHSTYINNNRRIVGSGTHEFKFPKWLNQGNKDDSQLEYQIQV